MHYFLKLTLTKHMKTYRCIHVELSFEWMKHTGLKGETEGLITADTGSGTEHQILQQTHHQAGNH